VPPLHAFISLRLALAGWLLLTNLSLGLCHQHEAEAGSSLDATHPEARHCHILVLGVELDCLSLNAETCPFCPDDSPDDECHLLLTSLLGPTEKVELGIMPASDDVALPVPVTLTPIGESSLSVLSPARALADPLPSEVALGLRSGVQQV
jgi:hypothetical protein